MVSVAVTAHLGSKFVAKASINDLSYIFISCLNSIIKVMLLFYLYFLLWPQGTGAQIGWYKRKISQNILDFTSSSSSWPTHIDTHKHTLTHTHVDTNAHKGEERDRSKSDTKSHHIQRWANVINRRKPFNHHNEEGKSEKKYLLNIFRCQTEFWIERRGKKDSDFSI